MSATDTNMLIGRLAVHYKILSKEQAAEAIRRWRTEAPDQDLADFLLERNYLTLEIVGKLRAG